ncbi:hypothetical protein WMY93_031666 [Mugilogobius chulae]|uniref:Hydroxyacid-oxoacid transhydrogenase, mitochondrial n=1 Tax=Mugilogobius chulae TaxID=88201 RepID=A0AAW0MHV6_9GOBI
MAGRDRIVTLLRQLERAACRCPAHSSFHKGAAAAPCTVRKTDYAFEMASSNIRFGPGVTREIGMDVVALGARRVCVMTDPVLATLKPVQSVLESLSENGITFKVYDRVRVEPTDTSMPSRVTANSGFDVLCHGMSYPISGNVKTHQAQGYGLEHPLVPHGLSVVLTSPAVFNFTSTMCPERHLEAAQILGADISSVKLSDSGRVLSETLRSFLFELQVEDGLQALGFTSEDVPALVQGTIPQERVTKLSPRSHTHDDLEELFHQSMRLY